MKNLISILTVFATLFFSSSLFFSANLQAQSTVDETVRDVYIKPNIIKYIYEPESFELQMCYRVKVKREGSNDWVKYSTFGFTQDIPSKHAKIEEKDFLNLDSQGRMFIGRYKANEEITIMFDSWEDDRGHRFKFENGGGLLSDNDDDYPDAIGKASLNGFEILPLSAGTSNFTVHYEIFQVR